MKEVFIKLAELLCQIMVEEDDRLDLSFKMPQEAIDKTVEALEKSYEEGNLKPNGEGGFYYAGMTADFGGYYEKEIEKFVI